MDFGLNGARVCIVGGTKGMGRECAEGFAREGACVAIASRHQPDIDRTVIELLRVGAPDAFGIACDVADEGQVDRLFSAVDRRWGRLNVLINMAWPVVAAQGKDFSDLPPQAWDMNAAALKGVTRSCQKALPLLRRGGWGRIINVSSVASRLGLPSSAAYVAAKAALNGLTKNMAWPLAREDILVNSVVPGVFLTPAMQSIVAASGDGSDAPTYHADDLHDVARWLTDRMKMRAVGAIGRVALPREIVPLVLLLGSPLNSFIVGAAIPIDGGTDWSTG